MDIVLWVSRYEVERGSIRIATMLAPGILLFIVFCSVLLVYKHTYPYP
jgi:hypothetical protein